MTHVNAWGQPDPIVLKGSCNPLSYAASCETAVIRQIDADPKHVLISFAPAAGHANMSFAGTLTGPGDLKVLRLYFDDNTTPIETKGRCKMFGDGSGPTHIDCLALAAKNRFLIVFTVAGKGP